MVELPGSCPHCGFEHETVEAAAQIESLKEVAEGVLAYAATLETLRYDAGGSDRGLRKMRMHLACLLVDARQALGLSPLEEEPEAESGG